MSYYIITEYFIHSESWNSLKLKIDINFSHVADFQKIKYFHFGKVMFTFLKNQEVQKSK